MDSSLDGHPAGWLKKPRVLGEGPRFLSHCAGPGEWGISLQICSLTYYVPSVLEQAVIQEDSSVWWWNVINSLDGLLVGFVFWGNLPTGNSLLAG